MTAKATTTTAATPSGTTGPTAGSQAPQRSARERALATFEKAVEKDTRKHSRDELARMKAFGDTMPAVAAEIDEEARTALFFLFESSATVSNARRIASHPLRPAIVDQMLQDALAKAAAAKAKAEADKAAEDATRNQAAQSDPDRPAGTRGA